jgi:hypothetical protein
MGNYHGIMVGPAADGERHYDDAVGWFTEPQPRQWRNPGRVRYIYGLVRLSVAHLIA